MTPHSGIPPEGRKFRSLAAKFSVFTGLLLLWVVLVTLGYDFTRNRLDLGKGILMMGIVLLLAAAIARFTSRQLVRPLAILRREMESAVHGNPEPVAYSRSGDEIEELGRCFNHMVERLRASQAEIQRQTEQLEEKIRQRTESLEEAMQRALAASQAKSEFLANISHELRTPMSGFLGMIELVLDTPLTREQKEQLETAQRCAVSLMALLNDVLDLSRIESGKMTLEKIPFDPKLIAEDSLKSLQAQAHQKAVRTRMSIDDAAGNVLGDPLRFRQILLNLLANAVKFTARGWLELRMKTLPSDDPRRLVLQIEVQDTGIGIPAERLPLIFEKFTQADGSVSRKFGGSGLGLAITRKLVELHNGSIRVESEAGNGSTFFVTLAFERAEDSGQKPAEAISAQSALPAAPKGHRSTGSILVVEDNQVNQRVVAAILRKKGYSVDIAANGKEALEMLARAMYSLVLMDVQMPVLDGLEATRKLRKDPRWRDLPVIAMTAHAMTGDREQCLKAGMNNYVSKPVHSGHLLAMVDQYVTSPPTRPAESPLPTRALMGPAPIDPMTAARWADGDSSILEGLVTLFLQLAPERLHKMHSAAAKGNIDVVLREGIQMRTAAEKIAAAGVVQCIQRIEDAAQRSELPALKHRLLLLEAELQRVSRHVSTWHEKLEKRSAADRELTPSPSAGSAPTPLLHPRP